MGRTKLILICQCFGEFVTNEDGSLSYNGGEAHAVDINGETLFDDLKLKLAEMWNFDYKSLTIKYFLPGNKQTLITLSNDKDLIRMYSFHESSVTADLFITGTPGFDRGALNLHGCARGVKLAETIIAKSVAKAPPTMSPVVATPLTTIYSTTVSRDADCTDGPFVATVTPGINNSLQAGTKSEISTIIDLECTPADTVKKRRRTTSWKNGAKSPTVVTVVNSAGEKRKNKSQKKDGKDCSIMKEDDHVDQGHDISPSKDSLSGYASNDVPPDKLVALWKDGITGVGQEFKSVYEFRDALQKYAVAHRFVYRLRKNDTNRASGRCITEGCSWKIHASWNSSTQSFRIKNMIKTHTCEEQTRKSAHPAKNWLVNIIKERLKDSPHHKPKEIADGILRDFGVELNYTQVWRGIEDAREQLQGSYKEAYNQLPWFCEKMAEVNPGSTVKLLTGDEKRFERLFVSFEALTHGFENGCRPILFLDSTSMKSKYHEMLLTATALDGEDAFFPVAFAIVETENDDNWHWFLQQLRSVVSTSCSITFVSDKEKGLKKLVLEIFENSHHGYSIHHLMENFRKNLKGPFYGDGKGSIPIILVAAAHAVRLDSFKSFTEQIKRVSSKAYDWLSQIEPEYWTNALFKGEQYNHITANAGELYSNWIKEVRELPITRKVEVLVHKITELMSARQTDSNECSSRLTPSKEQKLLQETSKAHGLKVLISSETLFEVHDDCTNVVNTEKWDCTCQGWKVNGLPCCHAIAVFRHTSKNVYDYCSKYFTIDSLRVTYSKSINHLQLDLYPPSNENTDLEVAHVLPPLTSRPPCSQHQQKETKTPRVAAGSGRVVSCSKCKEVGHNKATCKANL